MKPNQECDHPYTCWPFLMATHLTKGDLHLHHSPWDSNSHRVTGRFFSFQHSSKVDFFWWWESWGNKTTLKVKERHEPCNPYWLIIYDWNSYIYTTWKVEGATPISLGLSWPLTNPPFGGCRHLLSLQCNWVFSHPLYIHCITIQPRWTGHCCGDLALCSGRLGMVDDVWW